MWGENLSLKFNGVEVCLKNVQTVQGPKRQGDFHNGKELYPELSTDFVETFPLARRARICSAWIESLNCEHDAK
jgi:hypothetical protein